VGSWNEGLARDSGIADEVIVFDAFPRNSSEERVDLESKGSSFAQAVRGSFDLAIDLRTDPDTRFYLRYVTASVLAGLGTRAQFPYLDIFLPIDSTRHEPETAREDIMLPHHFNAQPFCKRNHFRIHCAATDVSSRLGAVIWGPYWKLRPGSYFFEPYIELDSDIEPDSPADGMLLIDIGLNGEQSIAKAITDASDLRLDFRVDEPDTLFEFRVWAPGDNKGAGFSFYGGRLVRQGAESVLHQSEYLSLLVELIRMRVAQQGLFREAQEAV
jgi:hypothetical protein